MQITWYGHSCFLLEAPGGPRVLTDPCDPETGYQLHGLEADIVTVSHAHHDHDCVGIIAGEPKVMREAGEQSIDGVRITGIPTCHDNEKGKLRGDNMVFLVEMDGLRILHLGDLGHMLDAALIKRIGTVDVIFAPVGGKYTIDAKTARKILDQLKPSVFIPMHYKTEALRFDIDDLGGFLKATKDLYIHRLNDASCTISPDALGEARVLILDYKKQELKQ